MCVYPSYLQPSMQQPQQQHWTLLCSGCWFHGREGMVPADEDLARWLRRTCPPGQPPIILAANKAETKEARRGEGRRERPCIVCRPRWLLLLQALLPLLLSACCTTEGSVCFKHYHLPAAHFASKQANFTGTWDACSWVSLLTAQPPSLVLPSRCLLRTTYTC